MQEIGKQYPQDDKTDKTGFLRRARLHQSKYRAEKLNLPCDNYGNYLNREDGEDGKNFYDKFGIFDAVEKYRKYNKPLYSNLLRSEHIPFNFFVPFRHDLTFCKNVFNEFFKGCIKSIDKTCIIDNKENIKIEFPPKPNKKYLADGTSFDTYIEYTHIDDSKGIIGIEVKYTEKEYKLKPGSKQDKDIHDKSTKYYSVTDLCELYKPDQIENLISDKFRQIWRNHILGESILLSDSSKFRHFTSLTLFPKDNTHFDKTSKEYIGLLTKNNNNFLPLYYEDFFAALNKYCPNEIYKKWIDYLVERYIVPKEIK